MAWNIVYSNAPPAPVVAIPGAGALVLSGAAPNVISAITPAQAALVLSGQVPIQNLGIIPPAGALSLTGYTPVSGAPAWFTAMADKTWAQPVNNATATTNGTNWLGASNVLDPLANTTNAQGGPAGIIRAWNGMALDRPNKRLALLAAGGHTDYAGNEVYAVDLSQAVPQWVRMRNATASPSDGADHTTWSDGRPCSSHTSNLVVSCNGRWFMFGMSATNYLGNTHTNQWWEFLHPTWALDNTNNDWSNLGTSGHASNSGGTASGGTLADEANSKIYVVHSGGNSPSLEIVSLPGLGITTNTNTFPAGGGTNVGFDSTNHVILVNGDTTSTYWSVGTPYTGAWATFTGSGSTPHSEQCWDWHAPSGAFLTWDQSGGGLLKGVPTVSGGNYTGITWSAVASLGGTSPTVDTNSRGTYNRVGIIPDMGNGQSALVVVNQWGAPDVHVFKIPVGGV